MSSTTLFSKAEVILKEIVISIISAFNSLKNQALLIGSLPCIEQKENVLDMIQQYLQKVPAVKPVFCSHDSCQLQTLETACRKTEGTGQDCAFIPSREFKARDCAGSGAFSKMS